MIKVKSAIQKILLFNLVLLLISCGGGSDSSLPNLPEPIPVGSVSGVVMIGPVENATITIYELDPKSGVGLEPPLSVEPITTSSTGKYSFTVEKRATETPLVVCATGGTYTEPATPIGDLNGLKNFDLGDKLCATFVYKKADAAAKKETTVNITFFTHLAYGLMQYAMNNGATTLTDKIIPENTQTGTPETVSLGAINSANDAVRQWLSFPDSDKLISITPKAINDTQSIENATPSTGLLYGLALAGISSTVDWLVVDQTKGGKAGSVVTEGSFKNVSSIALAQLTYKDVLFDGLLNGVTAETAAINMVGTALDAQIYLHHVPARMMAILNTTANETQKTINDFSVFISAFANYRNTPFNSTTVADNLNTTKPVILQPAGFDTTKLIKGSVTVKVNVLDVTGIQETTLTILDSTNTVVTIFDKLLPTEPQDSNDVSLKVWIIDTATIANDGLYSFIITTLNNNGISNELVLNNIKISNTGVDIVIKTPRPQNAPVYFNANSAIEIFEAQVADPFPNTTVNFDVVAPLVTDAQTAGLQVMPTPTTVAGSAGGVQTYQSTFNVPLLNDGDYQFRVVANSSSGQTVASFLQFGFDSILPTANITSHFDGQFVSQGTLTVKADVADTSSVNGYSSTIANAKLIVDNTSSTMVISNNVASADVGVAEGFHMIAVEVADKAGNKNNQATPITIGYDITPPKVNIAPTSKPNSSWVKSLANFSGTATDSPGTGITDVSITVGGTPHTPVTFDSTNPSGSVTATNISSAIDGQFEVALTATDASGKTAIDTFNVGFDNTPPGLSITVAKPATGVTNYTPPVTETIYTGPYYLDVTVNATELGAGISIAATQSGLYEVDDANSIHGGAGGTGSVIPDLVNSTFKYKLPIAINITNTTYTVSATRGRVYNDVKKYCFNSPPPQKNPDGTIKLDANGNPILSANSNASYGYRAIPFGNSDDIVVIIGELIIVNYLNGKEIINAKIGDFSKGAENGGICYSVDLYLGTGAEQGKALYYYTSYSSILYNWGDESVAAIDTNQVQFSNVSLISGVTDTPITPTKLIVSAKDNVGNFVEKNVCLTGNINNSANKTGNYGVAGGKLLTGALYDFLMSKTYIASSKTTEAPLQDECASLPKFTLNSNGLANENKGTSGTTSVTVIGALGVKCVGFSGSVLATNINVLDSSAGGTGLQPNLGIKNSYTITHQTKLLTAGGTCP